MLLTQVLTGALAAVVCGLDRIAVLQILLSRPIVAAPLVGLLLGDVAIGLQVGVMVELLWLARLPVGAAIPPDDTQIAVGATVLTSYFSRVLPASEPQLVVLCLLLALPFGKVGQLMERRARSFNTRLQRRTEDALERGLLALAFRQHRVGLLSFAVAAVASYLMIIVGGLILVPLLWPLLKAGLGYSHGWVQLAFPLIGIAVILGTINVNRAITLFCAAFGMAYLLMWLL